MADALEARAVFRHPLLTRLIFTVGTPFLVVVGLVGFWLPTDGKPKWVLVAMSIAVVALGLLNGYFAWQYAQSIAVDREGVEERRFGRRRSVRFADVVRAGWESGIIERPYVVHSADGTSIRFSKQLLGYEELLERVQERLPQAAMEQKVSFPYTLRATAASSWVLTILAVLGAIGLAAVSMSEESPLKRTPAMAGALACPVSLALFLVWRTRRWVFEQDTITQFRLLGYREYAVADLRSIDLRVSSSSREGTARSVYLAFEGGPQIVFSEGLFDAGGEELYLLLRALYGAMDG